MRYIDDILVVIPKNTNIENKLRMLNNVNSKIQFTVEKETNKCIPFLDVLIKRGEWNPRFSVYRKPTNKDDFIHSLSAHSEKTKSGVIIGFFLRAIRICSEECLKDEFEYISTCFQKLGYNKGLIIRLKNKAKQIMERRDDSNAIEKPKKFLTIPHSPEGDIIKSFISNDRLQIVSSSGMKVIDVTREGTNLNKNELSVVYNIPCSGCQYKYIGETSRGLTTRILEHRSDVRFHRTSNAIVQHNDTDNRLPDWQNAKVIHRGINKSLRKALESMHIELEQSTNNRSGFVTWSKTAAAIANRNWQLKENGRSQKRALSDPT